MVAEVPDIEADTASTGSLERKRSTRILDNSWADVGASWLLSQPSFFVWRFSAAVYLLTSLIISATKGPPDVEYLTNWSFYALCLSFAFLLAATVISWTGRGKGINSGASFILIWHQTFATAALFLDVVHWAVQHDYSSTESLRGYRGFVNINRHLVSTRVTSQLLDQHVCPRVERFSNFNLISHVFDTPVDQTRPWKQNLRFLCCIELQINFILVLIDLFLSNMEFKYINISFFIAYGTLYIIFSWIRFLYTGTFLYGFLDYRYVNPETGEYAMRPLLATIGSYIGLFTWAAISGCILVALSRTRRRFTSS